MSDLAATRAALDTADSDAAEALRLRARLAALATEVATARAHLDEVTRRHGAEEADVRRLEGVGWSALLAAVRGTRTGELDRERGEEVAARYALRSATERVTGLEAQREEIGRRLTALGDTTGRREAAVTAHADAVRASGASPELEAVLDELASVRAGLTEVEEARAAGVRAVTELDAARGHLGSADSWSAYDTWFGGGMVSSMVKHDRLDAAGQRVAAAQDALFTFARELADVGPAQRLRTDLGVTPTTRTLDIWFDNVFSDLSVRSRIKDSLGDVDAAADSVRTALDGLAERAAQLEQRQAALVERRDALLGT